MICRDNGERFESNIIYNKIMNDPYDYKRKGLLRLLMSPTITNTKNPVLRYMLDYEEKSLIFIMKYVDVLKNFRNWYWKNR